jgi:hypothetical protein
VAASHSHDASVGGLTSSSDATGEEEETTDTNEEQINKERRDPLHEVVDETDIKRSISRLKSLTDDDLRDASLNLDEGGPIYPSNL